MVIRSLVKSFLVIIIAVLLGVIALLGWSQALDFRQRLITTENRLNALQTYVTTQATSSGSILQELENRQAVIQRSQDQLLISAVAKTAPSVVSIVISQEVPKLDISYENPFGNDPFFKNFGFRIPTYRYRGTEKEQIGAGSGFLISKTGFILTNRHVVDNTNADYTVLLSDGQSRTAQVAYLDDSNDIAILKIDGQFDSVATLGNSGSIKLGQTVVAIGNALGEYNNSVSVGIVSGLNRTVQARSTASPEIEELSGVIQTDAAINPGNSGGPLIDLNGNVVGINVATVVGSSNISFAIPINSVKSAISKYIE